MANHEISDNPEHSERFERGKISVIRTERGKPWWRVTVYIGDSQEDIDKAVDEALRVDTRLQREMSGG